jgi:DNA-binding CsgD family transcriptional regulator
LGQSWRDPLQLLADAAGAKSAAVSRSVNSQLYLLGSKEFDGPLKLVGEGKAPRFSDGILLSPDHSQGFCADTDPRVRDRFSREPFFRDFMCCEIDVPWRASAQLYGASGPTGTYVTLWRSARQGPYEPDELAGLQAILAPVRMASVFARQGFERLPNEQAAPFERRGEPIFRLGIDGRVTELNYHAEAVLGGTLTIRQGRLVAMNPGEQAQIDRIIGEAVRSGTRSGMVAISNPAGVRSFLLVLPVLGQAREAFGVTQALAILINPAPKQAPKPPHFELVQAALGWTMREADVVAEIIDGNSPGTAAKRLQIGEGTARNHLKSAMQKAGVHSQVELAALVTRLT